MRWGINLRGDLAKLSEAEIATRFETLMADREAMYRDLHGHFGNKWLYQRRLQMPFGRGPLHARVFYKLIAFGYFGPSRKASLYDLYLLDCELKDVHDEIKRRVVRKKAIPVT
jgi:hypothetical protein